MNKNPEVDTWFEERDEPFEEAMQRVREILLKADKRIEECIKWSAPTFTYEGNMASFKPAKKLVSLVFHTGAQIPGEHPRLEGDGKKARTMRFSSLEEVNEAKKELEAVARAWCDSRA